MLPLTPQVILKNNKEKEKSTKKERTIKLIKKWKGVDYTIIITIHVYLQVKNSFHYCSCSILPLSPNSKISLELGNIEMRMRWDRCCCY